VRVREKYQLSEREACRIVGQPRGTQRYTVIARADEDGLTQAIMALAAQYGRYGYQRITQLLNEAGWDVGTDRVQRIWRREGLKVPWKQKPRGRLWLNDGSCIRLRPERRNHVWSYDFVEAQTHDGRKVRLMTLIDEFTRECLAIRVARRINSLGVLETMADVMLVRGVPEHIRSDNGPEMTAKIVRRWLASVGAKTLYIAPCSPWENGYCESSTESCGTNCLMARSSTVSRKPRSSSSNGASTTTRSGRTRRWDTDRLRHRLPARSRHPQSGVHGGICQ
jgi:putative transposase